PARGATGDPAAAAVAASNEPCPGRDEGIRRCTQVGAPAPPVGPGRRLPACRRGGTRRVARLAFAAASCATASVAATGHELSPKGYHAAPSSPTGPRESGGFFASWSRSANLHFSAGREQSRAVRV